MTQSNVTTPPGPGFVAALGRLTLELRDDVGSSVQLLISALGTARKCGRVASVRQAHILANRSIFFMTVVMAFTGSIMIVQACTQAMRLIGDLSAIGPGFAVLVIREFGPTIAGLMVAARYGAGVAAELGAMSVSEQVDALRVCGADPLAVLVLPRLAGGLIGCVTVSIYGTAVSYIAGGFAARYGFGMGWETYFDLWLLRPSDVIIGLCKTFANGVVIPLWACKVGLDARGGAPGVGEATTRAVIGASVGLLFFDLLIGGMGYVIVQLVGGGA